MTFSSAQTGLWSDCITSMHALYVCASTETSEADAAAAAWLFDLLSACLGVPGAPSAVEGGCSDDVSSVRGTVRSQDSLAA